MSRKWLLFLFCFALLVLLAPLSRAGMTVRVNESAFRIHFRSKSLDVALALENSLGSPIDQHILIQLIDPQSRIVASADRTESIGRGSQIIHLTLPLDVSKLQERDRRQLLWYRLHYQITPTQPATDVTADGVVSLSEITPELFELRVAAAEMAHEAMRYRARVQAIHPITKKPAEGVRIDAVLTLETDDTGGGVKLSAVGVTNAKGYSILFFDLPGRFPEFPHELRPSGGSIKVTGERSEFKAEAENDVLVDQFARMLVTTDKPLYQPGQALHMRALTLSPTKQAIANQEVIFRIEDPEDTGVFRETVKSSRFGIASVDWPIPENARLGDYWIKVALGTGEDSSQSRLKVRISRYDLPNFKVTAKPDRAYYLPGEDAEIKVSADYIFGQPVTRGHVRVVREVEREWNYKDQKWDIEEGDEYKGDTDANGAFIARIKLADEQNDLGDEDYRRFKDITYAAYFTDATTNRTEQRRFDLRLTKNAIHVYVIRSGNSFRQNPKLPLDFYVSAFYADGQPAVCRLNLSLKSKSDSRPQEQPAKFTILRTNRYGLAKVVGIRVPAARRGDDLELEITALDSRGKRGVHQEELEIDEDENEVRLDTDKSLYRPGEPIMASITSSIPNQQVVVDVGRDAVVLSSQMVRLAGGHAFITIPYKPEFRDRLTMAAYADFADTPGMMSIRTILYPRNLDLKIDASPMAKSYHPGDEAQVNFRVRTANGHAASALGLAVVDTAVDERFRTDNEFGKNSYGFSQSFADLFGRNDQIAGVSLRDLEHTDMSKPVPADLELVAEVLLNQSQNYHPFFFGSDSYDREAQNVFSDLTKSQLAPAKYALTTHYAKTGEYPKTQAQLQSMLSQAGLDLQGIRDPWGAAYLPLFSIDKESDVLSFKTGGPDKHFGTDDDLAIEGGRWLYFRPMGEAIDRAVSVYHSRTRGFIRDPDTLRAVTEAGGLSLYTLRDRWNQPYRINFDIDQSNYVIKVSSSGPDRKFEPEQSYQGDDFLIWISRIDYFDEPRTHIDEVLARKLRTNNKFPQNERELSEALRDSDQSLERLRDAWGHSYYTSFNVQPFYTDRIRIESRGNFGESPVQQTQVTPVAAKATVISLRSGGPDGKIGTVDDFSVATFAGVLTEQSGADAKPTTVKPPIIFSGTDGAVAGVITDPNGAVIARTVISATRTSDFQKYSTSSNDEGKYILANLPPGLYELRFEARGFMPTVITNVLVRSSNIVEINVAMRVAAATETVQVTSSAPMMQTTQASVSQSVVELPVGGRNFTLLRSGRVITKPGGTQQSSTPRLREYFPETLVWQPSLETDKQGRAQLKFKLADNITTWKMSVIGSTEDGQIGTVEKEITAFQPFFVEHDPPRVLTEGDEISLPVVVRNYLDRAQTVSLEIKPENWFALLGPATKSVNVAAGDAMRGTFDFRASASVRDGKQRITATASAANDAIEKPVTVHPDGEEKSVAASDIVSETGTVALDIPASAISNSTRAELKIYPNLLAHVAESVEAIMERPYGCGEQTISSTYPSLLLLRSYKKTGQDSPLRTKAERYLHAGYSRLLNYRDESGGFTYWGHGEPDLALTAYALRFLSQANEVIAIEDDVIKQARAWLIKQQHPDGSWAAYDYDKTENKRRTAMLTAYIARVLATTVDKENGETTKRNPQTAPELQRAFDYLSARVDEIDEPYLLASYALARLDWNDAAGAQKAIAKLPALAHEENGANYWAVESNTPFFGWGLAGRIETTAVVVQALSRAAQRRDVRDDQLIDRTLLFLLREKDRYGVWYSTQATINVLDALLTLLGRDVTNASNVSRTAAIIMNGRNVKSIDLPEPQRLVNPVTIDLSEFLQNGVNQIQIKRARGSSPASIQAVATYYLPWRESVATQEANWRANGSSGLRLVTKFDKTQTKVSDQINCHVEAERIGFHGYGMMLAEIGLPPGADVDRASLEQAMKGSNFDISQYDILPDRVVVYLWPRAGGTKFDFKFQPRFGMNAQTAASIIYDYYNPEARAIVAPTRFVVK